MLRSRRSQGDKEVEALGELLMSAPWWLGLDVAEEEVGAPAELLREQGLHVTEDLLRKVYDQRTAHFIDFIRHILGLQKPERSETVSRTARRIAFGRAETACHVREWGNTSQKWGNKCLKLPYS